MARKTKAQKREAWRASHAAADSNAAPELPKKKFYRQRAHANVFSDHALTYPVSPSHMDWSSHYPAFIDPDQAASEGSPRPLTKQVTAADIGCGFGGLLVALSSVLPDELILGLEIRTKVTEYVNERVQALRHQALISSSEQSPRAVSTTSPYQNVSALRANTMKFLPNFFPRATLNHIFLCFPDPHFKARKHKARIVSETLCAEYAYVLRVGGFVWTITDVEDLANWMSERFERYGKGRDGAVQGIFEAVELPDEGVEEQWHDSQVGNIVKCVREETEEGKKVTRNGGEKFVKLWRRREDPPWPDEGR